MKIYLLVLLLLNTVLFAACGNRDNSNSVTAAPVEKAADSSQPAEKSLPKIVAFGDSLTAGYGLPQTQSYPSLLQQKLDADGFKYEVINAGVSGDTSAGGVRRIDWALEGNVKYLILELGANDILRGQSLKEMQKNLGTIIERAQAKGVTVLLTGMEAPPNFGSDYQLEAHTAFPAVAEKYKVALLPFFLERVAGNATLNQPDGVHPNEEGAKIVAETVYQALKPELK